MKKTFISLILLLTGFAFGGKELFVPQTMAARAEGKAKLAIVIDDFGEDRHGVGEMLALDVPLTIAVIPHCEFSSADAEAASSHGHEVILHMPMENSSAMPPEYYGPVLIKNSHTGTEAAKVLSECIDSIPNCAGVNIHMGTGVSRNRELMTAMMEEVKSRDLYFLDSKTVEDSVCPECAEKTGVKFYCRDVFLEPYGHPGYDTAVKYIMDAATLALEKGQAIAIGHVGPVGLEKTAKALENCLPELEKMGVEVVPLSELD